jgi:hypothetical protein
MKIHQVAGHKIHSERSREHQSSNTGLKMRLQQLMSSGQDLKLLMILTIFSVQELMDRTAYTTLAVLLVVMPTP